VNAVPAAEPYPWRVAFGFVVAIAVGACLLAASIDVLPLPWTPRAAELAHEIPVPRGVRVTAVPASTPDPALLAQITDAFQTYSDIRAEAEWSLDGSRLTEIMPGAELAGSLKYLDELRASGRAVRTTVEHNMRVTRASADEAEVVDDLTDWSVYVDAITKQSIQPESAARHVTEVYFLRKIDGVWKVVGEG
jgi:hypothetical protein